MSNSPKLYKNEAERKAAVRQKGFADLTAEDLSNANKPKNTHKRTANLTNSLDEPKKAKTSGLGKGGF